MDLVLAERGAVGALDEESGTKRTRNSVSSAGYTWSSNCIDSCSGVKVGM